MIPLRPFMLAAGLAFTGIEMASGMDLPPATPLPEASQVLGWYGNLSAGRDRLSDFSVCFDPAAYSSSDCSMNKATLDDGLIFEAAVGYVFRNGFRLEGELSQRRNSLDDLRDVDHQLGLDRGGARELAVMLNGAYDFDTQTPLTPFVGAGLGGVRQYDDPGLLGDGMDFSAEDSAWKLGFQGFAGVQYEFTPDLQIGLRYSHKFVGKIGDDNGFDSGVDTGNTEGDSLRSRALMLTLTYEFGGP